MSQNCFFLCLGQTTVNHLSSTTIIISSLSLYNPFSPKQLKVYFKIWNININAECKAFYKLDYGAENHSGLLAHRVKFEPLPSARPTRSDPCLPLWGPLMPFTLLIFTLQTHRPPSMLSTYPTVIPQMGIRPRQALRNYWRHEWLFSLLVFSCYLTYGILSFRGNFMQNSNM